MQARRVRVQDGERGFALSMVVLLLFAIGVAGATGYQFVRLEAQLALQGQEGSRALAIARAGLTRFVAENGGNPPDSAVYEINGGIAVVDARRLVDQGAPDVVYLVTSTGMFTDPRYPDAPARRVVRQFANKEPMPFVPVGALASEARVFRIGNGFTVDGMDAAIAPCTTAGPPNLPGIVGGGEVRFMWNSANVDGDPPWVGNLGSAPVVSSRHQLRWDVLTDPSFPVEYDGIGEWPDFSTMHPDTFPVVRVESSLSAGSSRSGRGVLIVPGTFAPTRGFDWQGIILAGRLASVIWSGIDISGTMIGGLNGNQSLVIIGGSSQIEYNSCHVAAAARSLSYLNPLQNTWVETF